MSKTWFVFGLLLFLGIGTSAMTAMPVIFVDLDDVAPGIQNSRIAGTGEVFTIELILGNDGTSPIVFDTIVLELFMNDTPVGNDVLVPNLIPAPAIAGLLAGLAPNVVDLFSGLPIVPGESLEVEPPSPPPPPFRLTSGRLGYTALGGDFIVNPGAQVPVGKGPVTAGVGVNALGISTILAANLPFGTGAELSLDGAPILTRTEGGIVTVVAAVPEPGSIWLFGTIGLGTLMYRLRRKNLV